jgi:SMC interacting uncharacterized protein involved in chromosome segregation
MLIEAIVGILTIIASAVLTYLFKRLHKLETDTEARHQQDLDTLQKENTKLSGEVETLRDEVKQLRAQADQVPDLQRQINVLVEQLENLQEFKAKAEGWLESKDQKIKSQDKQLKTQARIINKQEDTIKRQEDRIRDQEAELRGWLKAAKAVGFEREQAKEEAQSDDGQSEQLSKSVGDAAGMGSGDESTKPVSPGDSVHSGTDSDVRDLASEKRDSGDQVGSEDVRGTSQDHRDDPERSDTASGMAALEPGSGDAGVETKAGEPEAQEGS